MACFRSPKDRNWPGILDSNYAIRKYFYLSPAKPKTQSPAAPEPPVEPSYEENASAAEQLECVGEEHVARVRPLHNPDWQLASDPTNLSDLGKLKCPVAEREKHCPHKKPRRSAWNWPAKLERLEHEARIEKSEWMEPLQRSFGGDSKFPQGDQRPQKAPRPQRVQRCVPNIGRKPADRPPRASTPLTRKRQSHQHSCRLSYPKRNILVVDAKNMQIPDERATGGSVASQLGDRGLLRQRSKISGRAKKSFGVPLCSRPTVIMHLDQTYSKQMRMRQEQLCHQPEYRDQYVFMMQQKLKHQQRCEQENLQRQQDLDEENLRRQPQSILQQVLGKRPYSVPLKSPQQRFSGGKRLCGNFYYE
ncbi:hypothetical protein KR018_008530 [Drosophila ironensis]|nr:hypothetical protein KR018_008530 [Drosophila ironensis]